MCRTAGEATVSKFPNLVAEWHPENEQQPCQVGKWSDISVKWKCSACSHEWMDTVRSRVCGRYCPSCHTVAKEARYRQVRESYVPKEPKLFVCGWCGNEFSSRWNKRGVARFCSSACAEAKRDDDKSKRYQNIKALLPVCATDHCEARVWRKGDLHCKVCQKRKDTTGSHEKFVLCSGGCGRKVDRVNKNTTFCNDCWIVELKRTGEEKRIRTCEVCGVRFVKKKTNSNAGRACSRECGFRLLRMDKAEGKRLTQSKRANAKASKLVGSLRLCCICALHFVPDNSQVNTCSRSCKRELQLRKIIAMHYGSYEAWLNKRCADCSGLVEETGSKRRYKGQYCLSCANIRNQASKKAAKFKRRRLANGVTSKHPSKEILKGIAEMIRNAGHKCSLCGLMMTRDCDPNNDRHIELDHKVPLSRGGTDTFDNIRAICRKCNGLKSDFTSPELVLVPRLETLGANPMDSHIKK